MSNAKWLASAVTAATLTLAAQSALAYSAGDVFVRGGFAKTDSRSSIDLVDPGNFQTGLDIRDGRGFTYGLGYLFHDNFGIELSGSQRVKHDVAIGGPVGFEGSFRRLPVNLMANYYPLGGLDSRVQPYVGGGLNYTTFSGEPEGVDMRRSYSAVGQAGIDLAITDNLLLNGSVNYADVRTRVSYEGENLGKARLDPLTIGGGFTLRF
ncbi:OmpW/AlkL family protein [Halomonas salifodinae]|uniref:OmpW/AlkL family protein n=1 Tax=Halomonas salifodinae TaxID=438745 RepID=UPI0033B641AC